MSETTNQPTQRSAPKCNAIKSLTGIWYSTSLKCSLYQLASSSAVQDCSPSAVRNATGTVVGGGTDGAEAEAMALSVAPEDANNSAGVDAGRTCQTPIVRTHARPARKTRTHTQSFRSVPVG